MVFGRIKMDNFDYYDTGLFVLLLISLAVIFISGIYLFMEAIK
jgi:hypothetical protein